jgi:hypothetical protein
MLEENSKEVIYGKIFARLIHRGTYTLDMVPEKHKKGTICAYYYIYGRMLADID